MMKEHSILEVCVLTLVAMVVVIAFNYTVADNFVLSLVFFALVLILLLMGIKGIKSKRLFKGERLMT